MKRLSAITSNAMREALREPPMRVLFRGQPGLPDGVYTLTPVASSPPKSTPKRSNRSTRRRLR